MPYRTERVSGRCRQASHPAPPSKQPPGQGALYVSEDNVTSCAMQAFIAGYCEISLIKSVSERRNYFEPGTDEYYNRKANTSSANTIGNDTGRTSRGIECYRQALSNWERDVNEPDLNMLKKICFLFGVNMDDFAKEVITKMETYEKKEKRQFNKYDMAIGLFYGVGIFLGIGIFFVGGFMTMSGAGWGASLFGGGCFSLVFGLICHAVITLRRNDK